jgi:site-specific DNA recombinase
MRIAVYVRVSGHRQKQGWQWQEVQIFRDDGYSGASLKRPGLDRLRDQAARAAFDLVLITVPDRLARKYVHQMLL